MKYIFSYSVVSTVVHDDCGGYETSSVLSRGCFNFTGFEDFSSQYVDSVLYAASRDYDGRGIRVYNLLELLRLFQIAFDEFLASSSKSSDGYFTDTVSPFVPTFSVKSVRIYFSFSESDLS